MKKEDLINKAIIGAELYGDYELPNGDVLTAELFPCENGTHSFEYNYAILDEDDYIIFSCYENNKDSLIGYLKSYF